MYEDSLNRGTVPGYFQLILRRLMDLRSSKPDTAIMTIVLKISGTKLRRWYPDQSNQSAAVIAASRVGRALLQDSRSRNMPAPPPLEPDSGHQ